MIRYASTTQLSIEEFKTPFEKSLLPDNRWVQLADFVRWDKFASLYMSRMSKDLGRKGISPRMVLGALIIKHKEKLDDRGVIAAIQENPYMQFFVGLPAFNPNPIFNHTLFVQIRERVGHKTFDALNSELIQAVSKKKDEKHNKKHTGGNNHGDPPANKGKLKIDATVADQYITYPTDNGLLNKSRKKCESLIDFLYQLNGKKGTKPRTYRKVLTGQYAGYTRKQKKSPATHRKMTRKLLEAVGRDIKHIGGLLDEFDGDGRPFPLKPRQQRMLWVISSVYEQQKYMYESKLHTCPDRIVNIFQPHVRPIPRGKTKAQTEFGAKLGVSLDDGFARISTLSWDAYHEAGDLVRQVEDYKSLHGHYPEVVQADRIYATRENRQWLKKRNIRITAPPLGRKRTKEPLSYYQKRKRKQEALERNHIEGKFGQGKNGYELNRIRARLRGTSESWIACIFFVMNLIYYEKCTNIFCSFFQAVEKAFLLIFWNQYPALEYQKAGSE